MLSSYYNTATGLSLLDTSNLGSQISALQAYELVQDNRLTSASNQLAASIQNTSNTLSASLLSTSNAITINLSSLIQSASNELALNLVSTSNQLYAYITAASNVLAQEIAAILLNDPSLSNLAALSNQLQAEISTVGNMAYFSSNNTDYTYQINGINYQGSVVLDVQLIPGQGFDTLVAQYAGTSSPFYAFADALPINWTPTTYQFTMGQLSSNHDVSSVSITEGNSVAGVVIPLITSIYNLLTANQNTQDATTGVLQDYISQALGFDKYTPTTMQTSPITWSATTKTLSVGIGTVHTASVILDDGLTQTTLSYNGTEATLDKALLVPSVLLHGTSTNTGTLSCDGTNITASAPLNVAGAVRGNTLLVDGGGTGYATFNYDQTTVSLNKPLNVSGNTQVNNLLVDGGGTSYATIGFDQTTLQINKPVQAASIALDNGGSTYGTLGFDGTNITINKTTNIAGNAQVNNLFIDGGGSTYATLGFNQTTVSLNKPLNVQSTVQANSLLVDGGGSTYATVGFDQTTLQINKPVQAASINLDNGGSTYGTVGFDGTNLTLNKSTKIDGNLQFSGNYSIDFTNGGSTAQISYPGGSYIYMNQPLSVKTWVSGTQLKAIQNVQLGQGAEWQLTGEPGLFAVQNKVGPNAYKNLFTVSPSITNVYGDLTVSGKITNANLQQQVNDANSAASKAQGSADAAAQSATDAAASATAAANSATAAASSATTCAGIAGLSSAFIGATGATGPAGAGFNGFTNPSGNTWYAWDTNNKSFGPYSMPVGPQGPTGATGATGAAGVGISGVTQLDATTMTVSKTDGTFSFITLPSGSNGVGISSITQPNGNTTMDVNLTNNTTQTVNLPPGPTGATGATGAAGVGIASITQPTINEMTITLTDNSTTNLTVPGNTAMTYNPWMYAGPGAIRFPGTIQAPQVIVRSNVIFGEFEVESRADDSTPWQMSSDGTTLVYVGDVYLDGSVRAIDLYAGSNLGETGFATAGFAITTAYDLATTSRVYIDGSLYIRESANVSFTAQSYTASPTAPLVIGSCNLSPGCVQVDNIGSAVWSNLNAQQQQGLAALSNAIIVDLAATSASLSSGYQAGDIATSNLVSAAYKNDLATASASLTTGYQSADQTLSNYLMSQITTASGGTSASLQSLSNALTADIGASAQSLSNALTADIGASAQSLSNNLIGIFNNATNLTTVAASNITGVLSTSSLPQFCPPWVLDQFTMVYINPNPNLNSSVGIGTTTSGGALTAYNKYGGIIGEFYGPGNVQILNVGSGSANCAQVGYEYFGPSDSRNYAYVGTSQSYNMYLSMGGNVGIGITNPQYPLHVNNAVPNAAGTYNPYAMGGYNLNNQSWTAGSFQVAIYCGTNAIVGSGIYCMSDERIKKDVDAYDEAEAIDKVRKLRPCTFRYKDLDRGNGVHTGFIAQEVKRVDKSLVKEDIADVIPDVYAMASLSETVLTFEQDYKFAQNDQLSIVLENGLKETVNICEVIDPMTIRIDRAVETKCGKLFVYGRYKNDILTIHYDAMVSVCVAALKNIDARLAALENQRSGV